MGTTNLLGGLLQGLSQSYLTQKQRTADEQVKLDENEMKTLQAAHKVAMETGDRDHAAFIQDEIIKRMSKAATTPEGKNFFARLAEQRAQQQPQASAPLPPTKAGGPQPNPNMQAQPQAQVQTNPPRTIPMPQFAGAGTLSAMPNFSRPEPPPPPEGMQPQRPDPEQVLQAELARNEQIVNQTYTHPTVRKNMLKAMNDETLKLFRTQQAQQLYSEAQQRPVDPYKSAGGSLYNTVTREWITPPPDPSKPVTQQIGAPREVEVIGADGKKFRTLAAYNETSAKWIDTNTGQPVQGKVAEPPPAPKGPATISPTAEANLTLKLNRDWNALTKEARTMQQQATIMDAGLAAARRGDLAAGSQAVLVTFQKILDPTSVVRESEYARSAAGQALLSRIEGFAQRLSSGGAGVPLAELEKFGQLAHEFVRNAASSAAIKNEQARIGLIADRYSIPREMVFGANPITSSGVEPPPAPTSTIEAGAGATAPKVGDTKTFPNGRKGRWDGSGWEAVQ